MADKKDPREEQLAQARKQADEDTKAHYERVSSSQPTPTQEENDRAKLGFRTVEELDDKEDDGSGPDKSAAAGAAPAGYSTRAVEPKK